MIVVVGNPTHAKDEHGSAAAGLTAGVARAAAAAGADVELVGKVGEDPAGEAVLLDLARIRVGHVAILRDPSHPTLEAPPSMDAVDASTAFTDADEAGNAARDSAPQRAAGGLTLEAADLELALRYLPDYRVLVVAEPLAEASLGVAMAAAGWTGAALVLIVPAGSAEPLAGDAATVIEAPPDDPDDVFAAVVGTYAAALDRGEEPAEAFAAASIERGWSAAPG